MPMSMPMPYRREGLHVRQRGREEAVAVRVGARRCLPCRAGPGGGARGVPPLHLREGAAERVAAADSGGRYAGPRRARVLLALAVIVLALVVALCVCVCVRVYVCICVCICVCVCVRVRGQREVVDVAGMGVGLVAPGGGGGVSPAGLRGQGPAGGGRQQAALRQPPEVARVLEVGRHAQLRAHAARVRPEPAQLGVEGFVQGLLRAEVVLRYDGRLEGPV
jgi:hypothetical protein